MYVFWTNLGELLAVVNVNVSSEIKPEKQGLFYAITSKGESVIVDGSELPNQDNCPIWDFTTRLMISKFLEQTYNVKVFI